MPEVVNQNLLIRRYLEACYQRAQQAAKKGSGEAFRTPSAGIKPEYSAGSVSFALPI